MRFKNYILLKDVLLDFFFQHILKSHENNNTWVNFMLFIWKHSSVKIKVSERTEKFTHTECRDIKVYILVFNVPQQKFKYLEHVINQMVLHGDKATETSNNNKCGA